MNAFFEFVTQPWPWYTAGIIISIVMFSLFYFGNSFGISFNLVTICSMLGAGKSCEYFQFDWKDHKWNLIFVLGMILGGYIASNFLSTDQAIDLSPETVSELTAYGMINPGGQIVPPEIFNWESLLTFKGIIMMVVGGFFVGFGTRYAGGCTSGHAITGLSSLQLPSLIAVIGFFIGGLFVTYFVLPYLLAL